MRGGHVRQVRRAGRGTDRVPGFADRVHAEWPRHDLGFAIAGLIARGTKRNSLKAPPLSFPAHVHSLVHGNHMSFFDMLKTSPWGDLPKVAVDHETDSNRTERGNE